MLLGLLLRPHLPKQINVPLPKIAPTATPAPTLAPSAQISISKVAKIVDGDTIELETGQKVRYIGIDTPETKHPKKGVECFGREAADRNKQLVEGKTVRLEKDVSEVDRYGRLLRYVFVINNPQKQASSGGFFVNDYLVREGYASAATFPPDVAYEEGFIAAQDEARTQEKGLWKTCR